MNKKNTKELNLNLENGQTAEVIATSEDISGIKQQQLDIMTSMMQQMLKAGADAKPIIVHYTENSE